MTVAINAISTKSATKKRLRREMIIGHRRRVSHPHVHDYISVDDAHAFDAVVVAGHRLLLDDRSFPAEPD